MRLTKPQTNALRLANCGALRWDRKHCLWGHAGVGVQVIHRATVLALQWRGLIDHGSVRETLRALSGEPAGYVEMPAMLPTDAGRTWYEANP